MKRMNSKYAFLPFLCILLLVLTAQTAVAGSLPEDVQLYIRFHNKQVYTPETPVHIYVGVVNSSETPFVFNVADRKIFSLRLSVTDIRNEPVSPTREYISRRHSDQQVLYRDVRLLPGEEYGFRVGLSSFVEVDRPGIYFIRAFLQPYLDNGTEISSNEITLHLRPRLDKDMETEELYERIETMETDVLKREHLPPDEVVRYMIRARQRDDWRRFFIYLDVESLLMEHRLKRERYTRASESERKEMIEDYKDLLRSSMVNDEILMKPTSFNILRYRVDMSNRDQAEVTVRSRFEYQDFTETKLYTYYLNRQEGFWHIYRYEVTHEGTE